jgi:hypothetical protein
MGLLFYQAYAIVFVVSNKTNTMNFEIPQSEEKEAPKVKGFDTVAHELLDDETLNDLSPRERAEVIADRFIGSVVRHGDVQGSKQSYSPDNIIGRMDLVGTTSGTEQYENLMRITGTNGLRSAVMELVSDEDVATLFGQLKERLSVGEEGEYTLTSPAQIEGYLLSGGEKNDVKGNFGEDIMAEQWVPVVLEHVDQLAQKPGLEWRTRTEARELIKEGGELSKNTGRDWLVALDAAEKAGVDVNVIRRSAEKIQRHQKDRQGFGNRALFLATGPSIKKYAHDLYSRSGVLD